MTATAATDTATQSGQRLPTSIERGFFITRTTFDQSRLAMEREKRATAPRAGLKAVVDSTKRCFFSFPKRCANFGNKKSQRTRSLPATPTAF
jgi:hypothetical protein